MQLKDKLGACGVIPVVVIDSSDEAVDTARALLSGGVNVMEVTFRTAAARDSIARVSSEVPEMTVGAGTVLNVSQCETALEAGAKFIVSPGFNRETVEYCVSQDITVVPGCVTPTEIMQALELGVDVVKFFPAAAYGGLDGMKALHSALKQASFVPTGGVGPANLAEYIAAPFIHAVGGSWLCKQKDIAAHDFAHITSLCSEARSIIDAVRKAK